jgi:endonuclease/exonuclease/phosphatase family metal-dependent hydrolase
VGDAAGEEHEEQHRDDASEAREHARQRSAARVSVTSRGPAPTLRSSRAADRVRVATWNCFGVPGGFVGLLTGRPNLPERLRSAPIARALAPYDVICIQENFLDSVSEFVEELADLLDMRVWHDRMLPEVLERSVFGAGLAILSAQPLEVRLRMFDVPACGMDMWASKGFASCELRTPSGASFRVVNLHLQSDDPPLRPSIYGPARSAQLRVLLDDLDRLEKMPTIVCGDLNVPEGSDEYREILLPSMRTYGFTEVAEGMGLQTYSPSRNWMVKKYDPHALDMRVDYVWTRSGDGRRFRTEGTPKLLLEEPLDEREGLFASDHFGVGVDLVLEDDE